MVNIAIALYKEYCGLGIGKAMLEIVLDIAEKMGYEQAELEVIANNKPAIALYEKLGFKMYGTFQTQNGAVEQKIEEAMKNYDYAASGYCLDTTQGRVFYFYHDPERFWKYVRPVKNCK